MIVFLKTKLHRSLLISWISVGVSMPKQKWKKEFFMIFVLPQYLCRVKGYSKLLLYEASNCLCLFLFFSVFRLSDSMIVKTSILFLVTCTRLYTPLCPSVRRMVCLSVGHTFTFLLILYL